MNKLCRYVEAGGYVGAVGLPVLRKDNAKGNFQRKQHPSGWTEAWKAAGGGQGLNESHTGEGK